MDIVSVLVQLRATTARIARQTAVEANARVSVVVAARTLAAFVSLRIIPDDNLQPVTGV
jgi:hypothetical protein